MNKGGIAIRLINFAKLFTGSIPGALAHTNAVANMLFGAISGSGTAAASAMGSIIGLSKRKKAMTGISQQRLISLPLLPVF